MERHDGPIRPRNSSLQRRREGDSTFVVLESRNMAHGWTVANWECGQVTTVKSTLSQWFPLSFDVSPVNFIRVENSGGARRKFRTLTRLRQCGIPIDKPTHPPAWPTIRGSLPEGMIFQRSETRGCCVGSCLPRFRTKPALIGGQSETCQSAKSVDFPSSFERFHIRPSPCHGHWSDWALPGSG